MLLTGATNMAPLRARGVQAYGLGPPVSVEESDRVHGNDERVSVEAIRQFVRFVYEAVVAVAASDKNRRPGQS
jgi:acetylornithine deacetylase/succinyl-diaminopimelate desuccinylase-like protein